MRPKIKTARRKAGKLHGATAGYVSLVDRGANETPFTLIKNQEGTHAMPIKQRNKKSHKTVGGGRKSAAKTKGTLVTEMAKMLFDSDSFTSKKSVTDKLVEMDWTVDNIEVTKTEDGDWEARLKGLSDDDYERTEQVETEEEGVYAFVGQRYAADDEEEASGSADDEDEADEDEAETVQANDDADADEADEEDEADGDQDGDEEDEEEVAASAKPKKPYKKVAKEKPTKLSKRQQFIAKREEDRSKERKFDAWDARYSKGNTLSKTLTDGMSWDATPPGYYEVQAAFNAAVGNIVSGEGMPEGTKQEALNKAAMDYAEIIGGLDSFFDDYIEADEETVQAAFDTEEKRESLAKWANDYADFQAGASEAPTVAAKSAPKEVKKSEDSRADNVADLIAKALEPLAKKVEAVSGTVESIANRRPSKKAAEPDDGKSGLDQSKKQASNDTVDDATWARQKQSKGLLG